jgi:uncharacterized membrane protein (UPF0127 family)
MTRLAGIALAIAIGLAVAGCSSSGRNSSATPAVTTTATDAVTPVTFETTSITYALDNSTATLDVEVASTPAQSERGLGYRDSLPDDAGMLFDLHETKIPQFWMKGMRFPLDMVWIGDDKRVAAITKGVPAQPGAADADLARISPPVPIRYVLEINAGAADRHDLRTGAQLAFDLPTQAP